MFKTAIAVLAAHIEQERQYKKYVLGLPPELRKLELKRHRKERKRLIEHSRKLEIARESRSLNFWGNR